MTIVFAYITVATDTETSCSSDDDDIDSDPCGEVNSDDDSASVQTNESSDIYILFSRYCPRRPTISR